MKNEFIKYYQTNGQTSYICYDEYEKSHPGWIILLDNLKISRKFYYFCCAIPEQNKLEWPNQIKGI